MASQMLKSCVSVANLCKQFTAISISTVRCLSTTRANRSLEEFFPQGVFDKEYEPPIPKFVNHGRRWRASELRLKSNEDIHKLWYVLLKERNMLSTVYWECRRQGMPMPSPHRIQKVRFSMKMIRTVLGERERALKELESRRWPFETAEKKKDKTFTKPLIPYTPRYQPRRWKRRRGRMGLKKHKK